MAFRKKISSGTDGDENAGEKMPTRILAYKFRIYPEYQKPDFDEEIKQRLFSEARAMNKFWNELVKIRNRALAALDVEYATAKAEHRPDDKISFSALKKLSPEFAAKTADIWTGYESEIQALAKSSEVKEALGWEAREDVFTRFEAAHKRVLKANGSLRFQSTGFIGNFHISHRFTGGGKEFDGFTTGRSKKLYLEKLSQELYDRSDYQSLKRRVGNGRFGVGLGDALQLNFRIVLHRQVPAGAKIKTAVLTGNCQSRKWKYHLVLTVDQPAEPVPLRSGSKVVAGLDLGWRKFEDYLRIGMIADSFGNAYELRLPINPPKTRRLRRLERLLAKHDRAVRQFPLTWQDIEDYQAKISNAKDLVKEQLRELKLPEDKDVGGLLQRWERVGKRGLLKLKRLLEGEQTIKTEDVEKALVLLNSWMTETFDRESDILYTRQRLLNQRKYIYALVANWLKATYAEIAVEGDLSLKDLAAAGAKARLSEENGAAVRNSAKYRVIASLYELKSAIWQRQQKGEVWLTSIKSAFTTTTCYVCGSECEKTARLEVVCSNGHKNDQDVQAAVNIRNKLAGEFPTPAPPFKIPEAMRDFVVPIAIK